MTYTAEQLKEMARPYFAQTNKIHSIIATSDGQFFYNDSAGRVAARNYSFGNKSQLYRVTENDIKTTTPDKVLSDQEENAVLGDIDRAGDTIESINTKKKKEVKKADEISVNEVEP